MSAITELTGLGMPAELAQVIGVETVSNGIVRSVATGLTATGTDLSTALQLTAFTSILSTVAASTGVKLPALWPVGAMGLIQNNGANALNIFPPTATIKLNGGTDGAAVTTAAAAGALIVRLSATDFGVYVLAKEA